ncbi:uncharacterized protein LOC124269520 isoform X2 [Haliotis rubra]|uniref:uncharacterized protein LOC124269520 isoform X2 n=1 Tax=Haliotis rubra TaxID=36100 RepID=UPI001EE57A82|nr:uncharacterized protein LOC124269520 isoform X2 [Haliotis rubra]
MCRILLLLFGFLGGCLNEAGSLVLTSSPMTARDGEIFTLICSSNTTSGQDRLWNRDHTLVLTTTQGFFSPSVSNPDAFNTYLSGRVNVSCNATQHNVTLRINSTIDNGSRWQCMDNPSGQWSNILTINVTVHQTTVTPTPTLSASVTTVTAITSTGSTDVNVSETSTPSTSKHLNTMSNTTTSTAATTTTEGYSITTSGTTGGQTNTIAIAAGAAGGGVTVIAVVIVAAICIRKRPRSVEGNGKHNTRDDRNSSRRAEMLIESGVNEDDEKVMMDNIIYTSSSEVAPAEYSIQDHNQADKVMQDNILYTSSSDIAPANYSIEDRKHVGKDVYTQVKKVKTSADTQEPTDVYAKPHKGLQETPNGDVYAKVNNVKSSEGTSENIEDMYAKPQKDKRNLRSKTGDE